MTQRKLADEELDKVMEARHAIKKMCSWSETSRGPDFWYSVFSELGAMADHATTDGKTYVDPEPLIPDGYRKAVAGDEGRADCKFWSPLASEWQMRARPDRSFVRGDHYAVPIDRVPTDEDAKSRPVVMVRDYDAQKWGKHTLICVRNCKSSKHWFVTIDSAIAEIICWKQCRHLYPGE